MKSPIALYTDPAFLLHNNGLGHPECPERLIVIDTLFEELEKQDSFHRIEQCPLASREEILRVHSADHFDRVKSACERGPSFLDPDTSVVPESWQAALRASGAATEGTRRVLSGDFSRAFCALRPPGHHAESNRAMGFCLFNHLAVAAADLLECGLRRVAIVDFDVHHGNGTAGIFREDARVFFASCHQWPHYPGTGAREDRACGNQRNRPLPSGSGDEEVLAWMKGELMELLREHRPEFLLISAGFDAHRLDPLSGLQLSTEAYGEFGRILGGAADEICEGRLLAVLEGGYHLQALRDSLSAFLEALRT
ncbi:MAG: histone deacetylase family protein [Candidatus Krumholzibacteria bacterium]|nr:histone deacetylase family protein [Candidatus Krumholzibacteria bacterium]MDP6669001.1 histone deacetylase family protein [Candidatus Krumholzibacteria bacterium]MDP6797394.1 histone deacetylase family protein [Candidatus Krumholzibacteria bacterium]MDP7021091.1 histone deacetylase family protein [Candidatus Krumholzibacteria bacterium]